MKDDSVLNTGKLFTGDFRTCTVGDMMEFLSNFDESTPMVATWEGIITGIKFSRLEDDLRCGFPADQCPAIILDVSQQYLTEEDDE